MKRLLQQVANRLIAMLPPVRPVFDVAPNQKLTIIMEPMGGQPEKADGVSRAHADVPGSALCDLLDALDTYDRVLATVTSTASERSAAYNDLHRRRDAFR